VLIVDFAPHLLRYIFSLLSISKEPKGLPYQLAFKVAKKLEQSVLGLYGGKFIEHLASPVIQLIRAQVASEGDSRTIYVNLLLINCFLHKA